MKLFGYITSFLGLIAFIYTGITYINNSESFGIFGLDIAVSKGDPVPMIFSLVVVIIGLLIARTAKS